METENLIPNEGQSEVVGTQNGGSEPVNLETNQEPAQIQTPEENTAFKQLRLEKEKFESEKKQFNKDREYSKKYSELGATTEQELKELYGNDGINSWEDVDNYYAAQQKNIDPEIYKKLQEQEEFINNIKREKVLTEQEQKLANDEKVGKFYKEWEKEVKDLANSFEGDLKGNLDVAFTLLAKDKLSQLAANQPNVEEIKKQGVKEYIENLKKGNAPIEGSGSTPVIMPKPTNSWDDARKASIEFLNNTRV